MKPAYDYKNQAWTVNGRYVRCGHPDHMKCSCYGKLHAGELAEILKDEKAVRPAVRPATKSLISAMAGYGKK